MQSMLERNLFLIKEHVGMFKAANNFDIFDPATGGEILQCREPDLGIVTKLLRFTDYKRMTPFDIEIRTPAGELVVQISRGWTFIRSKVEVNGPGGELLGTFRQRLLTIGGKFDVLDTSDQVICTLQGKWHSWDFRFMAGEMELAKVTKKWAGIGKELFTSADNYVLEIGAGVTPGHPVRPLILAAVMCIDMVLKE